MKIGSAIQTIRIKKHISQKELSNITQISPTSLSLIENNKKRPSVRNLTKICTALNIPEALVYFYGLEKADIPTKNKKLYNVIYPSIQQMITKLLL